MNLKIIWTSRFKKDYKAALKRGLDIALIDNIIRLLAKRETLPHRCSDHALTGDMIGWRECHIQPDWLLVYRVKEELLILTLSRTGTHSELFGK